MKPMDLTQRLEISRSRALQHRNFFEKYIKLLDALLALPEQEGNAEYIERTLDLMTLPRTGHGIDFKGIAKDLHGQLTKSMVGSRCSCSLTSVLRYSGTKTGAVFSQKLSCTRPWDS